MQFFCYDRLLSSTKNEGFSVFLRKDFMGSIVIKSNSNKNLKLLVALAEQLGETVNKLSPSQAEDIQLGIMMKKEKTGKTVSRKNIFKHLDS